MTSPKHTGQFTPDIAVVAGVPVIGSPHSAMLPPLGVQCLSPDMMAPFTRSQRNRQQMPDLLAKEITAAIRKAVICGADRKIKLVGAGLEGIVFVGPAWWNKTDKVAYKVGKRAKKTLEEEANSLEILSLAGASVPKFIHYSAEHDVITREYIEGTQPESKNMALCEDVFRFIVPVLAHHNITPPELSADAFIQRPDGEIIMVDLGLSRRIK